MTRERVVQEYKASATRCVKILLYAKDLGEAMIVMIASLLVAGHGILVSTKRFSPISGADYEDYEYVAFCVGLFFVDFLLSLQS